MTRSAIQLYTLRDVDRPFTELLGLIADAGFDGVEFAYRVTEADPDELVATLGKTDLDVAGAHVGIGDLEGDFQGTIALYEQLGVENIVVPWLGVDCFESYDAVDATVERLAVLEELLADYGMDLHYHNHDHEYTNLDEEAGFDAFIDATDFGIELDLGLALNGGDDPVDRLRSLGERSQLVHLKDFDVDAGESVPAGEGDLDLESVAAAVNDNDTDWLIYEFEGEDPLASLAQGSERTNNLC